MTTYGQQTLSNLRVEKDYYIPKQIVKLYRVSSQTVCLWCCTGVVKVDKQKASLRKQKAIGIDGAYIHKALKTLSRTKKN